MVYAIGPRLWGERIRSAAGRHGGGMRDRNDSRDVRPRIGSPLWVYLASVTAAGLAALVAAAVTVRAGGLLHLLAEPLFWAVAGLALLAEIRPIVTPGKSHPDYGTARRWASRSAWMTSGRARPWLGSGACRSARSRSMRP